MENSFYTRLKMFSEETGVSVSRLSVLCGLNKDTFSNYRTGGRSSNFPKANILQKLVEIGEEHGVSRSIDWFTRGIDEHRPPIQLVGRVGATERGLPFIDTTGYQAPAEKEYAPHFQGAKYIDEEHCTVAALVEGASMGEWLNGCYVYYNKPLITSVPEEWLGRVCVVLGADGEMYLKTILRGKNGLFNLKSGNGELIQDVKVEAVSLVLGYVQPQNKKT